MLLPHLGQVRELSQQFDNAWLSVSWSQLATVAIMQGRLEDARTLFNDGLTMSLQVESTVGVTLCLAAFARLAFASGTPHRAAVTLGAAEGLRRRVGIRVLSHTTRFTRPMTAFVMSVLCGRLASALLNTKWTIARPTRA
jgi:hypothetical protein